MTPSKWLLEMTFGNDSGNDPSKMTIKLKLKLWVEVGGQVEVEAEVDIWKSPDSRFLGNKIQLFQIPRNLDSQHVRTYVKNSYAQK